MNVPGGEILRRVAGALGPYRRRNAAEPRGRRYKRLDAAALSLLNPSSGLQRLLDAPVRPGRLVWIGLRTVRRGPVVEAARARLSPEAGLAGDRYGGRAGGKRQVTLIAREDLAAVAAFLGLPAVAPAQLRRNLVTEGVNLLALKQRFVAVGEAVLEITGECHPCSRMEEALGPGGYNALRGRGGLTARVVRAGEIRLGDPIVRIEGPDPAET